MERRRESPRRRIGHSFFPTRLRNHRGHHDAGIACRKRPTAKPARPLLNINRSFIAHRSSGERWSGNTYAPTDLPLWMPTRSGGNFRTFQVNRLATPSHERPDRYFAKDSVLSAVLRQMKAAHAVVGWATCRKSGSPRRTWGTRPRIKVLCGLRGFSRTTSSMTQRLTPVEPQLIAGEPESYAQQNQIEHIQLAAL